MMARSAAVATIWLNCSGVIRGAELLLQKLLCPVFITHLSTTFQFAIYAGTDAAYGTAQRAWFPEGGL
jgi:hypothetical protein